jgi:hypothetical protein
MTTSRRVVVKRFLGLLRLEHQLIKTVKPIGLASYSVVFDISKLSQPGGGGKAVDLLLPAVTGVSNANNISSKK